MVEVARGYAALEVDVPSGQRSQRVADVERILKRLTGAEAAAVVNNNAGATLLVLAAILPAGSGRFSRAACRDRG
jgi:L-seryl-tRNA(Ser) seleniumtransferase